MTPSTQALFLASLSVVVLGLAAALVPTGASHPVIVTGGALDVGSAGPDGTPRGQRHVLWAGCVLERPRDTP